MNEIQPDIDFIQQAKKISGSSLKECMQCGECTVVCSISPEDKPFPRKEIIWTGWGLKDKLLGNPDLWLCHQCGDCSTHCPRGINPADILSALRLINYLHYARPKFLARILSSAGYFPLTLAIPVIIILAIIYVAGTLKIPPGPVNFSKFFPHAWLNTSFLSFTFLVIGISLTGLRSFWSDLKNNYPCPKRLGIFKSIRAVISDTITHSNFSSCKTQKHRKISHMMVFYGFIMLLAVTVLAIIAVIRNKYPLPFLSPVKMLGNFAAMLLITGLSIMIYQRLFNKKTVGKSNYSDWLLLVSFYLLTLSGVFLEVGRFLNWSISYHFYVFHLVCVWYIIIYAPYMKFGHFIYRFVAMVYAESRGRNSH
jgi:quinone-modifying oxidoreductase subunit QmoC